MQEIPAGLARFATDQLSGRGMEIRTNTRIEEVTGHPAPLGDKLREEPPAPIEEQR